jgi:hypothetical protein
MSNKTKSSPVVVITVSPEQFNEALAGIATNGIAIKENFVIAAKFIAQATNKTEQDKSKKELAKAYQLLMSHLNGKLFAYDSATKWVQRNVKTLSGNPKFKWLVSKTAAAAKKRAARAGKVAAPAAAPAAPKATVTSIEKVRDALIAKEKKNLDDFINIIPSGKIKEFEQAYAAFIQTLELILK